MEKTLNRIMCGSRTPEGKIVAILLAFVLSFTTWSGDSVGNAFADEPAAVSAQSAEAQEQANGKSAEAVESDASEAEETTETSPEAESVASAEQPSEEVAAEPAANEEEAAVNESESSDNGNDGVGSSADEAVSNETASATNASSDDASSAVSANNTADEASRNAAESSSDEEVASTSDQTNGDENKVLEGTLTASDGSNFKILVSCTESAEIPAGAKLQVKEVSAKKEQAYVDEAAGALNLADDEFFFYTKFLDIKIVADGKEIQPKDQVEVTVKLMDMADANVDARQAESALQVVHFAETKQGPVGQVVEVTDTASKSASACDVTFQTNGFSVFGIGGIASKLFGWVDDFLNVAVYGISSTSNPGYKAMKVKTPEAGIELLEAYKVSGSNSMWVNVSLASELQLNKLESVSVYAVNDGQLGNELYANMSVGANETVALGEADGFALVKDTGLRERTFVTSNVKLDGFMPKEATVSVDDAVESKAVAALEESSGSKAVTAYDISIVADGGEYQPSAERPIAVAISDAQIAEVKTDELAVWHIANDGSAQQVTDFAVDGDTVSFNATGFSTYVVTTVLEKTITASDGSTYKVTVTYDKNTGIPEDASLKAEEVLASNELYATYLDKSADALSLGKEYLCGMKLLDITIVGKDGTEYQPNSNVAVTVELLEKKADATEAMRVVHFGNEPEELDASVDGSIVSFETDGFSMFSLVDVTLLGQVLKTIIGGGSDDAVLYENDDIVLTGKMPLLGSVEATPVNVKVDGQDALVAYDIKIYANPLFKALGICWQPSDGTVQVKLKSQALADKDVLNVYHMTDAASAPELVATVSATDSSVLFDAKSFSIYAVGEATNNDRVGYRFWYYNASSDSYVPITTQYFRYQDVHANPPMSIYEPSIPIITTPEEYQMLFQGWYKAQGTVTEESATLESSSTTIAQLNNELLARSEDDFVETEDHIEIIDVVAMLKAAYYITYVDVNANNILATELVPVATSGTTEFTVLSDVMPVNYESELKGWRNLDDPSTLYEEGETYPISSNMVLAPDIDGGYWLIFDDNDMVDDGTGKMVSGGASYTAPAFYMNAPNGGEVETTVRPEDPTWTGYEFGGWYTDAACTDGNEFQFGNTLTANTTVYAKWTPAASSYRIVIWKQRQDNAANATDAQKTYDYEGSELIEANVKTGDVITLASLGSQYTSNVYYLSSSDTDTTDRSYYVYNPNRSDQSIVVKADGSSVLNIRYDREPVTLNFYTFDYSQNNNGQFGLVDGTYVWLSRSGNNYYYLTNSSGSPIPNGSTVYYRGWFSWNETTEPSYADAYYSDKYTSANYRLTWRRYTGSLYSRSWQIKYSFTGLYGSTLAQNGYEWPIEYDWYSGHNNNGGTSGTRTTFLAAFTPTGDELGNTQVSFYGNSSSTGRIITFYQQQLDGTYAKVNSVNTSGGNFYISDKYVGFHAAQYSVNGGPWQDVGEKEANGYYGSAVSYSDTLDIRFDRTAYPLTFYTNNGANEVIVHHDSSTVLYGQTLENYANENPGQRAGCYFVGWYADPSFSTPFDFSMAMSNSPVTAYGYWRMERIRVVLVPGANNVDMGSQAHSFRLNYDERIADGLLSSAQRPGYKLEGWYTDPEFTNKFLFSTPVNSSVEGVDMTYQTAAKWATARTEYGDDTEAYENVRGILVLYAHWVVDTSVKGTNVQYDPGEAALYDPMGSLETTVPVDPNFYQDGAEVVVQAAPSGYSDLYNFLYWEAIDQDGNVVQTSLHPGAHFNVDDIEPYETTEANGEVVRKTIMLRAKYEKSDEAQARFTTITYDGNTFIEDMYVGGSQTLQGKTLDGFDHQSVTLDKEINETIVLPGTESFYLPGYELVGWSFTEGSFEDQEKAFDLKQKVAADNLDASELNTHKNTLYAMWKPKTYDVTVKQVVENGVPQSSFGYQYESRKSSSPVAAEYAELAGNSSFTVEDFGYYNRIGDLFKVSKTVPVPEDADYAVRVSAKVTKDDGTTETLNPDADGNYWILGDVEITFTYSLKVPVSFAKRDSTSHETVLTGAVFQLTPVQFDSNTQRWVNAGDGQTLTIDDATVVKYLQEGVYRIEETSPPDDYAKMSTVLLLTVHKDSDFSLRTQSGAEVSANIAGLIGNPATTLVMYDVPIRTVTLTKEVEGGAREGGFDFTVTAYDESGSLLGRYDIGAGVTNNVGELEFQGMVDGDAKVLRIPHGSKLVITEDEYPHCVTTYTWDGVAGFGSTCTIESVDKDGTVTFKNVLTPAPTGVVSDSSPYGALLVAGVMLLVLALPFTGRSRRRSSDLLGFLRKKGGRTV